MNNFTIGAQKVPLTQSLGQQKFNKDEYFKELNRWIWRAPSSEIPVREQCVEQIVNAYETGKMHLGFYGPDITDPPPLFPGLTLELSLTDSTKWGQHEEAEFLWLTAKRSDKP